MIENVFPEIACQFLAVAIMMLPQYINIGRYLLPSYCSPSDASSKYGYRGPIGVMAGTTKRQDFTDRKTCTLGRHRPHGS